MLNRLIRSLLVVIATTVCLQPAIASVAPPNVWTVESGEIDASHYFGESVANGMIGLTTSPKPFRTEKALIYGAYETAEPGYVSSILDTFNFLDLVLSIDGEQIVNAKQLGHFRQSLDLRGAVFTTAFEFKDKARVVYKIRALRQLPYTALLEVSISATRPISISVASAISQSNEDPPRFADFPLLLTGVSASSSISKSYASERDPRLVLKLYSASAKSQFGRHEIAAAQGFMFDDRLHAPSIVQQKDGLQFTKTLPSNSSFHFALAGSTLTSTHVSDPLNEARRLTAFAMSQGIENLIRRHEHSWDDLWKSDIIIDGDDDTQRDVHSMLYHLYSSIREGTRYSIPPAGLTRGLTGYLGHIFWDAELWMYPALLALKPQLARSMVSYRYDRLAAAKRRAQAHGFSGALFPWESAATGDEDSPSAELGPELQHHISADVAIAAWNYFRVTQDRQWLRDEGYPLIKETADFWASRVTRNGPGRFDIDTVQGADEYAVGVDNNAFTNAAAKENLTIAQAASQILGALPDPDWERVRTNIPILKFSDGVTREHASYNGETIKQGDANLLAYPLREITDRSAIIRDLEYYYGRYDSLTGPSYSKAAFAILHQRVGQTQKAYEIFKDAYRRNQRPPFGTISECPTCNNPYFVTSAGSLLQTMLYGFGGLEITEQGIKQTSLGALPTGWRSLTLVGIGPEQRTYSVK